MVQVPFLQDLVVVVAAAAVAALGLGFLRVPPVSAYLLAGVLIGPHALGLVQAVGSIAILSEVGVVLLLFTIGLEFSRSRLRHLRRWLLFGGSLQVVLTGLAAAVVALALGQSWQRATFFGCGAALSSTAIALRALSRDELEAPHGQFVVGVLVFQDLLVVPMVLAVPVLAGADSGQVGAELVRAIALSVVVVGLALFGGRFVMPRVFAAVDRLRSRETFLLAVVAVCIGTAWLTSLAGLSLALGAFLAGVVIAESDYAHRALADVLPLRDVLASLFFLSLGMSADPRALLDRPGTVALLLAGLLLGKSLLAGASALALGMPARSALLAGAALMPFSEFGFVLAQVAEKTGLLAAVDLQATLTAAVGSMIVAPAGLVAAHRIAHLLPRGQGGKAGPSTADEGLRGHVVVVGHGVAGQVLSRALQRCGLPYRVLELNAATVRRLRGQGVPVAYGDAANPEALRHARVEHALALVLLINDPLAAERAIAAARHFAPHTPVVVRARYLRDAERLQALGATDVVTDEVEAAVEVLARVLQTAGTRRTAWLQRVAEAREATLPSVRDPTAASRHLDELAEDVDIARVEVDEAAPAVGQTLAGLAVRQQTGALVVAVRREGHEVLAADPDLTFLYGDMVYLMGPPAALDRARALFAASAVSAPGTEPPVS